MLTNRPQSSRKRQQAQAVTEFIIAWPIILLAICFVVQLFWLWWAQQTLHTATQYAARSGAINHGSQQKMRMTLIGAMAGIKPQLNHEQPLVASLAAVAEQTLHYSLYGSIKVRQPTDEQFKQFSQRRWNVEQQQWVTEIPVDHYAARKAKQNSDEWAAARRLVIEAQWCESLKIPLAAEFLGLIAKRRGECLLGNSSGQPQWPLNSSAEHEMLSGYRK